MYMYFSVGDGIKQLYNYTCGYPNNLIVFIVLAAIITSLCLCMVTITPVCSLNLSIVATIGTVLKKCPYFRGRFV